MTVHKFAPTRFYNSIGSHGPALRIGDGDTVVSGTLDAHGFDREGRLARSYKRVRAVKSSAAHVEAEWQSMTLS